jgi:hypothetical protein
MAAVDALGNFASSNLTINGNGRLIEGATSVTLNVNGTARQWMYRADTGNWVRISSLAAGDEMPFPQEFDDYFQVRLALRLVSRHSTSLALKASSRSGARKRSSGLATAVHAASRTWERSGSSTATVMASAVAPIF